MHKIVGKNGYIFTIEDFSVFKCLKGCLELGNGCIPIFDTLSDVDVQLAQSSVNPAIHLYPLRVVRVTGNCGSSL